MVLTTAQKQALRADILAAVDQPTITARTAQDWDTVAAIYNALVSPAFWSWRSSVTRSEIYTKQNDLAISGAQTGFWEWDTFKAQTVTEQNTWREMFMGDQANFAAANIRNGVAKIFTGTAANNAQRDHCLAVGRRQVTRLEKLFSTGTGSTASPATMAVEGNVTAQQVSDAMGGL